MQGRGTTGIHHRLRSDLRLQGRVAVDAQEPARENGAARLPSLQQIVKHLDFEEPDAAPNSLPHSFYRYIAPSQGFPPFGSMRLTSAGGYAGEGALEFTLGGGSMSARVTNGVVPILPLTDYSISVRVRTEGLKHARARVGAWLSDQTGEPIHDSRVQSRLAETGGAWDLLTVEINGRFLNAADLIVDLQVVQEAQFASAQRDPAQPRLEDITGRVFFDEVTVSHLPHVSLTMPHAGNLVRTQW